ncbi:MAG: hypothetical protein JWQ71_2963 [Pedosphaera sp.]|nr:hypothetical protein [Pedosphaera sp.]
MQHALTSAGYFSNLRPVNWQIASLNIQHLPYQGINQTMEEQPPLTSHEAPPQSSSLITRLTNIFVAPAEVFDEVKATPPKHSNWIVPLILSISIGIIYTLVVFSQPGVIQKIKDAEDKKIQQRVEQGKMKKQDADNAQAMIEKIMTPTVFKLIGIGGAVFGSSALLFLIAAIIWLLGRFLFKGEVTYLQALQVNGLSSMISVLGAIVAMLLVVIYGNVSMTPGPALLIRNFDPANKMHLLLSGLNVFSLWYVAVLSLGLARLSGAPFWKAAAWIFGIWGFFTLGPALAFGGR